MPLGYYKDETKTADSFVTIDGERWVLLGDMATIDADGTISVLGRGSVCINTGGEKVYPEEVEAVLKSHPAVYDAIVTGVPDERYGQRVAALVQLRPERRRRPTEQHLDRPCPRTRRRLQGAARPWSSYRRSGARRAARRTTLGPRRIARGACPVDGVPATG